LIEPSWIPIVITEDADACTAGNTEAGNAKLNTAKTMADAAATTADFALIVLILSSRVLPAKPHTVRLGPDSVNDGQDCPKSIMRLICHFSEHEY
jgi:hypothetical protein